MAPVLAYPRSSLSPTSGSSSSYTFFHTVTSPKAKQEPPASTTTAHSSAIPRQTNLQPHAPTSRHVASQQPSTPAQPLLPPSSTHASPTKISLLSPSSLNAFAVSTLSANAHPSRPAPKVNDGSLPKNYKAAARRITLAMVAAPIAIVTSWVLWERLVMGQERKRLIRESVEEGGGESF